MTNEEMMDKLRTIVKPYVKNEEGFARMTEESDLLKDLRINSANLVDVILDIENEFNIIIDNESMEKMLTVRSAMDIINTKLSEQ
ncbi:MAG: acyl carrier protein [Chitinophagaceae bacterium]|nr:acyl carrier protein [Chitinophagaceae bacterium]MBL0056298.1 acyl carrier protein [Chitinophagaceae bacterium]